MSNPVRHTEQPEGTDHISWPGFVAVRGLDEIAKPPGKGVIKAAWLLRYLLGPPSSAAPAKILRPSARVTLRALASLLPSLARYPSMVTVSPGFREFRVQPRRMRPLGLPSSNSQLVTLPASSVTST